MKHHLKTIDFPKTRFEAPQIYFRQIIHQETKICPQKTAAVQKKKGEGNSSDNSI
jgi:hypothetical protein